MNVTAVTVARRDRAASGEVCQDAARIVLGRDDLIVLVVADGVGSAPRSERGAERATQLIGDALASTRVVVLDEVLERLEAGRDRWLDEMDGPTVPSSARKITFGFAVIRHPDLVIGAVGDCFVFGTRTGDPHGTDLLIDQGRGGGRYANEVEATLADSGWRTAMRRGAVTDVTITGVGVSSDGLGAVAIREEPVWRDGSRRVEQATGIPAFTHWLFDKVRRGESSVEIGADLAGWDELMAVTGDDLGFALAAW